jgi:intracellular septation protein A
MNPLNYHFLKAVLYKYKKKMQRRYIIRIIMKFFFFHSTCFINTSHTIIRLPAIYWLCSYLYLYEATSNILIMQLLIFVWGYQQYIDYSVTYICMRLPAIYWLFSYLYLYKATSNTLIIQLLIFAPHKPHHVDQRKSRFN